MSDLDKIQAVQEFADAHDEFDGAFVDSLDGFWREHGALSVRQRQALDNIMDEWHISLEGEEDKDEKEAMELDERKESQHETKVKSSLQLPSQPTKHDKIEQIRRFAKCYNTKTMRVFDLDFVENLQRALNKHGKLTPGQECALDNIIRKWKM